MDKSLGLVKYIVKNDRARTILVVALLGVAGLMEGFGVAAALPILDSMMTGDAGGSGFAASVQDFVRGIGLDPNVGTLLVLLVVVFALKGVAFYFAILTVGTIVARLVMELRLRLLRAVTEAEWRHVLEYPSGYISHAISAEASRTGMAYAEFSQMLAEGIQVMVYLTLVFMISWQTGAAAIVAGVGILLILQRWVSSSRKAGHSQVQILRSLLARLTDALPSLKPLKAMGMEQYLLPRLEQQAEQLFQTQREEIRSVELIKKAREPVLMAALAGGLWGVLTLTDLSGGSIMILAVLFYRSVTSITNMQQRWVSVVIGESSFRSFMEHITSAEEARETWASAGTTHPSFAHELRLERLSFSYGSNHVLKDVSLVLPAGRFVTLTGPSGSGKTTLVDLITSLLRPTGGRILADGTDLSEVNVREWRNRIGYVPQDPMLFSDSVRANLTLGRDGIPDATLERALRDASAWDFVEALPHGLDQAIGEAGTQLSGGQKQRIAIARALVNRPNLLVLDEPTAALDGVAEQEICRAIETLRGKLSILAVSHQEALRFLADEVWEVRDGRVKVILKEGDEADLAGTASRSAS